MEKTTKKQIPLDFPYKPYMGIDDFITSPANTEAFNTVESWPEWSFFAVNLYGPQRSGKTHLTHIFSDKVCNLIKSPYPIPRIEASMVDIKIPPLLFEKNKQLIVENLNEEIDQEAMFHLYNLYRNEGGNILFTSIVPPARMKFSLPDLQSRLNIVPSYEIKEPDDELLSALIIKLFMDRQITIPLEVINYILANMERSFAYTHKLVAEIDNISLTYKRAVTIPIVKEAILFLNTNNQTELF